MALITETIGPFSQIFVGDAASSTPLIQVLGFTTGGSTLTYNIPEQFLDVKGNSAQAGRASVRLPITILSDSDQATILANGNTLEMLVAGYSPDSFSQFKTLTVLLVHPNGDSGNHSILLPNVYVQKNYTVNQSKTEITRTPLVFFGTNRDRTVQLYYKRTNAQLGTILGVRNPGF